MTAWQRWPGCVCGQQGLASMPLCLFCPVVGYQQGLLAPAIGIQG